jgi:hypothetical protein
MISLCGEARTNLIKARSSSHTVTDQNSRERNLAPEEEQRSPSERPSCSPTRSAVHTNFGIAPRPARRKYETIARYPLSPRAAA